MSVCIAQTLLVLEEEASQAEAMDYLHCAATRGSPHAAFLLWHQKHKHKVCWNSYCDRVCKCGENGSFALI